VKTWIQNKIRKFSSDKDLSELIKGSATTFIVKILGNILGFAFMLLVTKDTEKKELVFGEGIF
ncbi:MAG: hypothetical protein CMP66_03205, partial [Flavobacteriales bacterium]|nr:hypothetical protein [Flavobacteriales bacterium]